MLLAEALKEKSRLVETITTLRKRILNSNRRIAGNEITYTIPELLSELTAATTKLIILKARIQRTNAPIQEKIFEMAELRSRLAMMRKMECASGKQSGSRYSDNIVEYEVQVTERQRDNTVNEMTTRIDAIQNEVDKFNYATELGN